MDPAYGTTQGDGDPEPFCEVRANVNISAKQKHRNTLGHAGLQAGNGSVVLPALLTLMVVMGAAPDRLCAQQNDGPSVSIPDAPSITSDAAQIAPDAVAGNVAILSSLLRERKVSEMRTAYEDVYGVSEFLDISTATYYVALFQNHELWRVISTNQAARADRVFRIFRRQAHELALTALQRVQAEASLARYEREAALANARLDQLRADLQIGQQQQALVQSQQEQTRADVSSLKATQARNQQVLRALRERQTELEHELAAGLR